MDDNIKEKIYSKGSQKLKNINIQHLTSFEVIWLIIFEFDF